MSEALAKAIRRTSAIASLAFASTRQVGGSSGAIDLVPSDMASGLDSWQKQQAYAHRYSQMRGWVYSAINALASEAAGQHAVVARLSGVKREQKPRGSKLLELTRMPLSTRRKAAEQEYEIQRDHPLVDLLERPNPIQERWQFVYSFVANLVITGWAYIVLGRAKGKDGKLEMYSLPTTWVKPVHDKGSFSSFEVRNPRATGVEPAMLDRSQVGFAHLPNPGDPMAALAPASTQMMAIRVDDHIQTSQEAFFRNGIFPSVIITMGQGPYQDTKGRPVLTGAQRRQINLALKKRWVGDANQGNAAIIDGLIDKIEPWSVSHREMGWERSEEKVRTRILSAFGVHPFILGEAVGVGGYAQAVIIQERFHKRVNTYLEMLGNLLTNLLGGLDESERMIVWFEQCRASDKSLRQTLLQFMRSNGDISQNELRAEAGFPPDEDLNQAVIQPSMMAGIAQFLSLLGTGQMQREQAVVAFELMGLPSGEAEKLAGMGLPKAEPQPLLEGPKPSSEEEKLGEEEKSEEAMEELKMANLLLARAMEASEWQAERILRSVECSC